MADPTCEEKIVLVKAALLDLQLGKKKVSISYGERRVQYSEADIATLQGLLNQLEDECGSRTERSIRRPLRGIFG